MTCRRSITPSVNLSPKQCFAAITDAFDTLLFGGDRVIRVYGPIADSDMTIDLVLPDEPLRACHADLCAQRRILSLLISLITASLVFIAINRIDPADPPDDRQHAGLLDDPENPGRIIVPNRGDELGIAERDLASMQTRLQQTLKEQRHLADLGLAVSKINHDMRNILASAQLMSDRLSMVSDPLVSVSRPNSAHARPSGELFGARCWPMARPARPTRAASSISRRWQSRGRGSCRGSIRGRHRVSCSDVNPDLEIEADSEQMFRVLYNLVRNSRQAFASDPDDDAALVKRVTLSAPAWARWSRSASRTPGRACRQKARENLFKPFKGSARPAAPAWGWRSRGNWCWPMAARSRLTRALRKAPRSIELPDQPVPLDTFRARAESAGIAAR
jgi:hypothetical protein